MNIAVATPETLLEHAVLAMRQGEDAIPAALDALPAPVYATDREGRVIFANRACAGFAGREPQPGEDRWCVTWKLYSQSGEFLPHDRCPMAVAIRERRSVRGIPAVAERPDGGRVEFLPFPTPVFDEAGEFIGAVNLLLDVSTRKKAEQLSAQASRCRRLAKSVCDPRTAETLKLMAGEYEEQARSLDRPH